MKVISETTIGEYPLLGRGKVRDIYEIDPQTLLLVTTDRMSAFDVIMDRPIPYKGVVLNQITLFWMGMFRDLVPNHLISADVADFPAPLKADADELEGRAVLVKKARPLLLECVVRGHLAGSGWQEYRNSGTVCGHRLPAGLNESAKLEKPIFTPATKAEFGEHDENITEAQAEKLLGKNLFATARDLSVAIFSRAREYAATRGVIIADTKFEFGLLDGGIVWIDEALTPDSSRFWPADAYEEGKSQPSFDKQYLRDWLLRQSWDKTPPAPALPDGVVRETALKYLDIYKILTGTDLGLHP